MDGRDGDRPANDPGVDGPFDGAAEGRGRFDRVTTARVVIALVVVAAVVVAGYAAVATGAVEITASADRMTSSADDTDKSARGAAEVGEAGPADSPDSTKPKEPTEPTEPSEPTGTPVPVLEAYAPPADAPTKAGVKAVLDDLLAEGSLGPHVGVSVRDVATGKPLYGRGADEGHIPASTTKILTATAVLEALGPEHRFETSVVYGEPVDEPKAPVPIVLVGGGDPLLASKKTVNSGQELYTQRVTIEELAERTAKALRAAGTTTVRVDFDDTLFEEPVSPDWEEQYVPSGVVAPVTALWVDQARLYWPSSMPRAEDPAQDAADRFVAALEDAEITVEGDPERATAPADAEQVARVQSAPLDRIVEYVLLTSNNESAEVLGRHVAVAEGEPATFAGTTTAIGAVLGRLGIDPAGNELDDASGLARTNSLRPNLITSVLTTAADPANPHLRATLTGLPVAGFTGSLDWRFVYTGADGAGFVRGKTGTLTGVSSLAGLVTTADGDLLAYAIVADRVDGTDPRPAIDAAAAALAACGCR